MQLQGQSLELHQRDQASEEDWRSSEPVVCSRILRQARVLSCSAPKCLMTLRTRVAEISMPWRSQIVRKSSYSDASLSVTDWKPWRAIWTRLVKFMIDVWNISSSLGSGSI